MQQTRSGIGLRGPGRLQPSACHLGRERGVHRRQPFGYVGRARRARCGGAGTVRSRVSPDSVLGVPPLAGRYAAAGHESRARRDDRGRRSSAQWIRAAFPLSQGAGPCELRLCAGVGGRRNEVRERRGRGCAACNRRCRAQALDRRRRGAQAERPTLRPERRGRSRPGSFAGRQGVSLQHLQDRAGAARHRACP